MNWKELRNYSESVHRVTKGTGLPILRCSQMLWRKNSRECVHSSHFCSDRAALVETPISCLRSAKAVPRTNPEARHLSERVWQMNFGQSAVENSWFLFWRQGRPVQVYFQEFADFFRHFFIRIVVSQTQNVQLISIFNVLPMLFKIHFQYVSTYLILIS